MNDPSSENRKVIADAITFCVIGIAATTQHLVHIAAGEATDDLELIAEESLCMTSVATARVLSFALQDKPDVLPTMIQSILEVPLRYYDYILGNQILEQQDQGAEQPVDDVETPYARLVKKIDFYTAHFPDGSYPGPKLTTEKLSLFMGRISSPGLHEHPEKRVERLELPQMFSRHLRLVRGFTTQLLLDLDPDQK